MKSSGMQRGFREILHILGIVFNEYYRFPILESIILVIFFLLYTPLLFTASFGGGTFNRDITVVYMLPVFTTYSGQAFYLFLLLSLLNLYPISREFGTKSIKILVASFGRKSITLTFILLSIFYSALTLLPIIFFIITECPRILFNLNALVLLLIMSIYLIFLSTFFLLLSFLVKNIYGVIFSLPLYYVSYLLNIIKYRNIFSLIFLLPLFILNDISYRFQPYLIDRYLYVISFYILFCPISWITIYKYFRGMEL